MSETAVTREKNGELSEVSRTSWFGGRVRVRFLQHAEPGERAPR
ncbi:MAG TPA: hypothetical protein VGD73_12055 [Pseudonocardia sp.]